MAGTGGVRAADVLLPVAVAGRIDREIAVGKTRAARRDGADLRDRGGGAAAADSLPPAIRHTRDRAVPARDQGNLKCQIGNLDSRKEQSMTLEHFIQFGGVCHLSLLIAGAL